MMPAKVETANSHGFVGFASDHEATQSLRRRTLLPPPNETTTTSITSITTTTTTRAATTATVTTTTLIHCIRNESTHKHKK